MNRGVTILVTGGAGSIGSEVVRRLVADGKRVRVADINEEALWALRLEVPDADYMLADCLVDAERMVSGCAAVIHCAAVKHIDLCEQNPTIAHRVNVEATQAVLRAAPMRPFVLLSTDKALQPSSVMGYCKRMAELEVIRCGGNVVRFGNVIGTRGSLVPMVKRCAALGRPIPITDPDMTRWMMGVSEAVDLILEALQSKITGKVFTPLRPRAVRIGEFLMMCRDEFAPSAALVTYGARPGERKHEPMELRSGEVVWSHDDNHRMSSEDALALIAESVAQAVPA